MKILNEATFNSAIQGERFVFVLFGAEWCQPCKDFKVLLEASKLPGSYYVDVDKCQTLARDHNVKSVPAVRGFIDGELALERNRGIRYSLINEFKGLCEEARR
jgi:thioredoxin-like negative regulator of GroEL